MSIRTNKPSSIPIPASTPDDAQDSLLALRDGMVAYASAGVEQMLGAASGALGGRPAAEILDPVPLERLAAKLTDDKLRDGIATAGELILCHPDGRERIPVLAALSRPTSGPWAGGLAIALRRSTDWQREADETEHGERALRDIIDSLPDTYYRTDRSGRVVFCTNTAEEIFGLPPEQLIGKPLADFYVTPAERAAVVERILAARGSYVLVEARVKRADGGISWASTRARALFDASGAFDGVEGSGRDITQRIFTEQALRDSLEKLEQKERAKSSFLAAASHDLRQPIQAINLLLDGLRNTPLDNAQRRLGDNLSLAVGSLTSLLDALLDVSRLDAGAVSPSPRAVDLHELFAELAVNCSPPALDKGVAFRLWFPTETTAIYTDRAMLVSILRNLVVNAIANTNAGGVLVSARNRGWQILFQVWDTGHGIAPEHRERIFEEFYQINNPQRDRTKGLGLGLAIVRRTAALLGATVSYRSIVGRGTVFEFALPRFNAALHGSDDRGKSDREPADRSAFRGKRVLVVEDDEQVAQSLKVWLGSLGASMQRYADADIALGMGDAEAFDYCIVDFRLPGSRNGIEFLDEAQRRAKRKLRAVLITGDTSPDFIARAKASGWPMLFKPVVAEQLLTLLGSMETPQ